MLRSVCRTACFIGWVAAAAAAAHGSDRSLALLIEAAVRHGPASQLPAHLSMVLGVSRTEAPTPVKQAVKRDGATVRTFNVCETNHDNVVLINYNEQSQASKAYLVSSSGTLRKAVAFKAGAPAVERRPAQAQAAFAAELKFWTDVQNRPGALR